MEWTQWVFIICGGFLGTMFLGAIGALVVGILLSSDGRE